MTPVEKANYDQERELVRYWRDKHYENLQVIFTLNQMVGQLVEEVNRLKDSERKR